jgi:hypothetical protein
MRTRLPNLAALAAFALMALTLGGCGTINEKLTVPATDYLPHWLGGEPADVPPRPGSAKYDEFMRERERKRLEPAVTTEDATSPSATPKASLDPVH